MSYTNSILPSRFDFEEKQLTYKENANCALKTRIFSPPLPCSARLSGSGRQTRRCTSGGIPNPATQKRHPAPGEAYNRSFFCMYTNAYQNKNNHFTLSTHSRPPLSDTHNQIWISPLAALSGGWRVRRANGLPSMIAYWPAPRGQFQRSA